MSSELKTRQDTLDNPIYAELFLLILWGINYAQALSKQTNKSPSIIIRQLHALEKEKLIKKEKQALLNKTIYCINWHGVLNQIIIISQKRWVNLQDQLDSFVSDKHAKRMKLFCEKLAPTNKNLKNTLIQTGLTLDNLKIYFKEPKESLDDFLKINWIDLINTKELHSLLEKYFFIITIINVTPERKYVFQISLRRIFEQIIINISRTNPTYLKSIKNKQIKKFFMRILFLENALTNSPDLILWQQYINKLSS